jgi:hypothetical protein
MRDHPPVAAHRHEVLTMIIGWINDLIDLIFKLLKG